MKNAIFPVALACLTISSFGKWKSAADRYMDVHLEYTNASAPIPEDGIQHFVYFARDREALREHSLLTHPRFSGAQIMYQWRELEPEKGAYDFSSIREDEEYLRAHGKKLFIQLQDATFDEKNKGVPKYLEHSDYDGGMSPQRDENGKVEGWVAKRWNKNVRTRFAKLMKALGDEFDGKIEGINLQETAISISKETDPEFDTDAYAEAVKANMLALKNAFPQSAKIQYANFMPGEWLPWEDEGYLKSIYQYGEEIGVGLGGPDLMIQRKGQLNHALAMMHESDYSVPLGVAIQDGNYIGKTGADYNGGDESEDIEASSGRKNIVPQLHAFAKDFLKIDYMFWVNQEPYFEQDVLPCFAPEE